MSSNRLRLLACSAFFLLAPVIASAQSQTDAQRALEANPALLQQLRSRILSSGLTPDQIRARLRAEGYPETLLDAYIPGGSGNGSDVVNSGTPDDVLTAVSQLGIVDTADVETLRCATSTSVDSIGATVDTSVAARAARAASIARRTRCQARLDSLNAKLAPSDSARIRAVVDSGFTIFGLAMFRQGTDAVRPEPQRTR